MDNLKMHNLKNDLISTLNNYEIPIEAKRLILGEVYQLVKDASKQQIDNELVQTQMQAQQTENEQENEQNVDNELFE